ncbi:MAG: hypothetical protein DRQ51_08940 [Gammaproteobacteria bacterium]|nr:MAG: hypothetical protein DRQ51_08940 [Gammaproteobacteria bacterium]
MIFGTRFFLFLCLFFLSFVTEAIADDNLSAKLTVLYQNYNQKIQSYTETYNNDDLIQPIISYGILLYSKNKILQRTQSNPSHQKITFKDGMITIQENKGKMYVFMEDYEDLKLIFDTIDGILGGDLLKLKNNFSTEFFNKKDKYLWQMRLKKSTETYPIITIEGQKKIINTITILQENNDIRTITIKNN